MQKIKYTSFDEFMYECARLDCTPLIHWYDDGAESCGFIYFKTKDEFHVFYSSSKEKLDAIFNSIGLTS